jgi:hypothetical protein
MDIVYHHHLLPVQQQNGNQVMIQMEAIPKEGKNSTIFFKKLYEFIFLVKQKHRYKKKHRYLMLIVLQVRLPPFDERRKHQVIVMILVNFFIIL